MYLIRNYTLTNLIHAYFYKQSRLLSIFVQCAPCSITLSVLETQCWDELFFSPFLELVYIWSILPSRPLKHWNYRLEVSHLASLLIDLKYLLKCLSVFHQKGSHIILWTAQEIKAHDSLICSPTQLHCVVSLRSFFFFFKVTRNLQMVSSGDIPTFVSLLLISIESSPPHTHFSEALMWPSCLLS